MKTMLMFTSIPDDVVADRIALHNVVVIGRYVLIASEQSYTILLMATAAVAGRLL